ncbi:hypothetical protein [Streptomyces xantholiticus]|uniref:Uncharacterized protein n=1 Tax=Streptomyces xantholiticus TaxID=68285 RepID=A0ABV1V3E9_9ACTN
MLSLIHFQDLPLTAGIRQEGIQSAPHDSSLVHDLIGLFGDVSIASAARLVGGRASGASS